MAEIPREISLKHHQFLLQLSGEHSAEHAVLQLAFLAESVRVRSSCSSATGVSIDRIVRLSLLLSFFNSRNIGL
jgi:hypothetical protein